MARHNKTGKKGEALAVKYLRDAGWEILETNWRFGRAEVDIIGREGELLVFVEVKTRSSLYFGRPEEAVSTRKMELMAQAAGRYMEQVGHEWEIRFDVISVWLPPDRPHRLDHLRDAFFPGL